jgi:hypothetical protein
MSDKTDLSGPGCFLFGLCVLIGWLVWILASLIIWIISGVVKMIRKTEEKK